MKNIASIKQNITRLNKYCDLTNSTLLDCLNARNLKVADFCMLIGLDAILLNDITLQELKYILKDPQTRIIYSTGMTSLNNDEIEIYSPNNRTSICFSENSIKVIWDNTVSKEDFDYYTSEFLETRKNSEFLETIYFSSDLTIDPTVATNRIISLKYPLEHACLKIKYTKQNLTGEVLEEKAFEITINHELFYSDLRNIFRILYNFNYSLAVNILKLYPASFKIMSDEVKMNNFHNR